MLYMPPLTLAYSTADPPGDSFIQEFDAHITNAFPKLEQISPLSSWTRGDIIEIQGAAASGKTHLLYFWALTCALPHKTSITIDRGQKKIDLLLGGRNKSVIVCDCDGHWCLRRLNTIITSYLHNRISKTFPGVSSCTPTISEMASDALKRVHTFRPTSTLSLVSTLMAVPEYHRTKMPYEDIGMLMIDGISSFYWVDRWLLEQVDDVSETTMKVDPISAAPSEKPQLPKPILQRADTNPLRHVLTIILQLRRSLGIVTLLTNWGLTMLDRPPPAPVVYFRQHLRAPYPSPFESEPRSSKFPLTHHITIPSQGLGPFDEGTTLEEAVEVREQENRVKGLKMRVIVRTIGKLPGESPAVVESEFEFAITEDSVLVS
ncbi:hypothetical protein CTheo_7794 [Ceratobasidium theobromae]|uniref:DNA recombination and repair protein Rad51-like C-terminal domain-containing protein n=1 Tax=Ceratobasidium theobromae TaxID=1582974 RepID=A0A5N5QB74_9AGAM|nr:hypothetical protein CTheo_7794 [Ceratobasidium theobromae]